MAKKKYYDENGNPVKKKHSILKWVGIAIGVLFVLGIIGSMFGGGENDESASTANTVQTEQTNETSSDNEQKPEIEVTATEIIDTFSANELKGKDTYTGKRAKITGTVESIDEMLGQKFITLGTDSDPYSIISLQCFFKDDNAGELSNLQQGQQVTLEGTIGEQSTNIDVKDCKLVN